MPTSNNDGKWMNDNMGPVDKNAEPPFKGDIKEIIAFFKEQDGKETLQVKDFGQGRGEKEGSCFFLVMASILLKDEKRYMELRYFFYYFYTAIASMDIDSDIFNFDKYSKQQEAEIEANKTKIDEKNK